MVIIQKWDKIEDFCGGLCERATRGKKHRQDLKVDEAANFLPISLKYLQILVLVL